ncbi:hypothetical protein SB6411_01095 [Klebsiella spallanzanii]|jgi:hypothetical protein|uniref:Uncharacterized protein n=1 Tax=Klebsiella spallanzanii TaxID=2587528 RepID=A0A564IGF6_9ENTR|nr:hypothetical protein SB6419_00630 [Klebsiella spallanzanii]VUS47671.1 hypothetical protein SB6411_01095 [Klebsiella spallanzanii]VUS98661.1 hypothetical protein SB6408_01802 [Klebsiella spallanzanii]
MILSTASGPVQDRFYAAEKKVCYHSVKMR